MNEKDEEEGKTATPTTMNILCLYRSFFDSFIIFFFWSYVHHSTHPVAVWTDMLAIQLLPCMLSHNIFICTRIMYMWHVCLYAADLDWYVAYTRFSIFIYRNEKKYNFTSGILCYYMSEHNKHPAVYLFRISSLLWFCSVREPVVGRLW